MALAPLPLTTAIAGLMPTPWVRWLNELKQAVDELWKLEGEWTPVLGGTGGATGVTYALQHGRYVKVGRIVHVQARVTLSNRGSITGTVTLEGLPFAAGALYGGLAVPYFASMNTSLTWLAGLVEPSATRALMHYRSGVATSVSSLTGLDLGNSTDLIFAGTYEASS